VPKDDSSARKPQRRARESPTEIALWFKTGDAYTRMQQGSLDSALCEPVEMGPRTTAPLTFNGFVVPPEENGQPMFGVEPYLYRRVMVEWRIVLVISGRVCRFLQLMNRATDEFSNSNH
jgi:hypothetical protein